MKKLNLLKILLFILFIINITSLSCNITAKGEKYNKKIEKYVALGDLQSTEMKISSDNRYSSIINDFFLSINTELKYENLNNVGIKSSELIEIINESKEKIKDSDIISLTIGVNDILSPLVENICKAKNEEINKNFSDNEIINKFYNDENIKKQFLDSIKLFDENFKVIIDKLIKLAPDADIYISSLANFTDESGINFLEEQVKMVNDIINKYQYSNKYMIIDLYELLNGKNAFDFEITIEKLSLSFNNVGHAILASEIISKYEDYVDININKIDNSEGILKGKTLPNTKLIIISDSGGIISTTTNKFGEFKVYIRDIKEINKISLLVYDKKIFSILYKKKDIYI